MGDNDNGGNDNCNVALNIPRSGSSGPLFPVRVEFGMLVFFFFFFGGWGKKTGAPEENRRSKNKNQQLNPPYVTTLQWVKRTPAIVPSPLPIEWGWPG